MLWLCLRFANLPVELRPRELEKLAVTDRVRTRRIVIAANEAARANGIHPGMEATRALLKEPELRLVERSKSGERRALHALADWALQFSSTIHVEPTRWLLWLEIGASLRYFEGLTPLQARIAQGIVALDYSATLGIAPTLEAAALFSNAPHARPVIHRADIPSQASPLNLSLLFLEDKTMEQLAATGLTTVGALLAVPGDALARRFGPEMTGYLHRLLGNQPDPRRAHRASEIYRRSYEFADPIHSVEGLLFPLRRIMQEFEGYLRGRDCAIQRVDLTLRHRDSPESSFSLHTSAPCATLRVCSPCCVKSSSGHHGSRQPPPSSFGRKNFRRPRFFRPTSSTTHNGKGQVGRRCSTSSVPAWANRPSVNSD